MRLRASKWHEPPSPGPLVSTEPTSSDWDGCHSEEPESPARALSGDERRVLDLLLAPEFDGVHELRRQAANAVVVGRCRCGCPTIDIDVRSDDEPAAIRGSLAPFEANIAPDCDGVPGQIILFLNAGRISSMEYVYFTDTVPSEWPPVSRLSVVEVPHT